ncbi:12988_t:CDS:1, partial [Dentiscutata heterogama]
EHDSIPRDRGSGTSEDGHKISHKPGEYWDLCSWNIWERLVTRVKKKFVVTSIGNLRI